MPKHAQAEAALHRPWRLQRFAHPATAPPISAANAVAVTVAPLPMRRDGRTYEDAGIVVKI